eukprot:TCALIF_04699-PA protein Name:"Similar to SCNN1A Amiloride-sensitive sodium channel subunit alpha (Cavia porcellus)" AED:0.34 eAED:0.34 QI:34/0.25/0.2/0.4/1/1/5/0/314
MGLLRVIRETFLDFGRNTSIAGLNNAMKAKSIIRSLIWLTLFSVGLYFTLVGIISVVKDYNQYPVVTKTELQQEKLVNFPAISICNHNRVHCNNLLTQYYTLKEVLENGTTTSGLNQTILILSELFDKTGCRAQVCDQIIEPLAVNRSATVNYSSTDWNLVRLAQIDCNLESEERELICYHLAFAYEETTNNSKYTGPVIIQKPLNSTQPTLYPLRFWFAQDTPGYGNCYSFNAAFADIDDAAPRKASLTGITNGFSIQLFLDQENYMLKKLSKKAGARLVIHDTRSPPLPDEYGIDLQPNTASSIAIQKVDTT